MQQATIQKIAVLGVVVIVLVALGFSLDSFRPQGNGGNLVATVIQCADAIDNDNDGLFDKEDPACWRDPRDPKTYQNDDLVEKVLNANLEFSVPERVALGERATLSWRAENILTDSCSVTGRNGDGPWTEDVGEKNTCPLTAATIFTLRCYNLKNSLVVEQRVVNIK